MINKNIALQFYYLLMYHCGFEVIVCIHKLLFIIVAMNMTLIILFFITNNFFDGGQDF